MTEHRYPMTQTHHTLTGGRRRIRRLAAWAVCMFLVCAPALVTAQQSGGRADTQGDSETQRPVSAAYKAALAQGNKAYNQEDYETAIGAYTKAIQAAPMQPEAYRNMARALFWQGQYDASLAYYDTYLVTFPGAQDTQQIQKERRLTGERATKPWTLPESQRVAMRQLEDKLDAGPAYTRGGGGAWKSYQMLLRTGYAQPGLAKLKKRLFEQLIDEFDEILVTEQGQPSPQVTLEEWQLERARLKAAGQLITSEAPEVTELAAREHIPEAAIDLLMSRFEEAATHAELATQQNPDLILVRWYRISALMRANRAEAALGVLQDLKPLLQEQDPAQLSYYQVVRAMILQRLGQHDDAASIYVGIFRGEAR